MFDEAYIGDGSGGMTELEGKFSTSDTYMEVVAPIVSPDMNIPFLEEVTLSGAYREMDHSVSGEDNVDSLSLVVRVNSALALRCLLYTSPSPRDKRQSRMQSSA